jgi:hypothetical protein
MTTLEFGDLKVECDLKRKVLGDICEIQYGELTTPPKASSEGKGGTIFDRLMAEDDDESREPVVIKSQRWTQDADLMKSEWTALTTIRPSSEPEHKFFRYFPRPITRVGGEKVQHIMSYRPEMLTLEAVHAAYPGGIDFQDFAWMFKRMLAGAGFAHNHGFIHGALVPSHVLIHPTERGAKLIDWCYSTNVSEHRSIRAYVKAYKDFYPPEVFAKRFPTPAVDIYMIAKLAVYLLGGDVKTNTLPVGKLHPKLETLLLVCLAEAPSTRRQSAWDLHEEFDKILETIVGKPAFRVFEMPKV